MPYIKRDMLMLENQLPMLVLDRLVGVEKDGEFVNKLILKFCRPCTHIERMGKCLHILDVFRKSMLMEPKKAQPELDKMGHDVVRRLSGRSPSSATLGSIQEE
ncbi:hypothetical protein NL676_005576 [Syzygium grande]|nr:hypothetical protein NL676_005576 [Syzygium grande]